MLIKINSTNQNFSFLLQKHPDSILAKRIRQGYGIGWHCNGYNIRFVDQPDEISYPDYPNQQYEYLTQSKYNSPLCVYNCIKEFCRLKEQDTEDSTNTIEFVMSCSNRAAENISKYFKNVTITQFTRWKNNYKVKITSNRLYLAIDTALVLCFCVALDNRENIYVDDELIIAIAKKAQSIRAPYFLRYKLKCCISEKNFHKLKPLIELENEKLTFGYNLDQRISFVKSHLTGKSIVDIGCSTGTYLFLSRKVPQYIAVDIDEKVLDIVRKKVEDRQLTNVVVTNELPKDMTQYDVILTEVIEHISDPHAFMKKIKAKRIIVTTPNKDFNHLYGVESRHDDHKFEWTKQECIDFFSVYGKVTYFDVGDVVNGVCTTIGIVCEIYKQSVLTKLITFPAQCVRVIKENLLKIFNRD